MSLFHVRAVYQIYICLPCVMVIKRQIYVVSGHFLRQVVKIKNDLTVINIEICMRWSAVHITNVMSIVHITTSTGLFPVYITHVLYVAFIGILS